MTIARLVGAATALLLLGAVVRPPESTAAAETAAASETTRTRMWIEAQRDASSCEISALAISPGGGRISYELRMRKQGPSGASSSAQRGEAELLPGRATVLSRVRVGLGEGDRLDVALEGAAGEGELAGDTLSLPAP